MHVPVSRRPYRHYHTDIKILARLELLPDHYKKNIPRSTRHEWKQNDIPYFGQALSDEKLQAVISALKSKRFVKILVARLRIQRTLQEIIHGVTETMSAHEVRKRVVSVIHRVKDVIGFSRALRYCNLAAATFYAWRREHESACQLSAISKCSRVWPNQLTGGEAETMREILENPDSRHEPIYVKAWKAVREGRLFVAVNSWYYYARIFGITHHKHLFRRPQKTGIRAARPGGIIHADLTVFRLRDDTRVYIYLIIDNFSRKILGWKASMKAEAGEFIDTLKSAFRTQVQPKLRENERSILLVDGGSESNNDEVQVFLDSTDGALQKLVAQRDIIFSNSMIEAFNKTLKYRHLFNHDIHNFKELVKHLDDFIPEYNGRPHCAHTYGSTPDEIFAGREPSRIDIQRQFEVARRARVDANRNMRCVPAVER